MASQVVSARLKYLSDSACLLAAASPTTAAHLQVCYNRVLEDNDMPLLDARKRSVCSACGFPFHRRRSKVRARPARKSKEARSTSQSRSDSEAKTTYECSVCSSRTYVLYSPAARQLMADKPQQPVSVNQCASQQVTSIPGSDSSVQSKQSDPIATSASTSSKKRARSRKQTSLQAMLTKSRSEANSQAGFGMDLLDLMKMG
ncbi:hypothetical protein EJ06DRAFT_379790 [Trichodelitschia bisporula]|uniref:Rpr2-domain-containing protein n=1 Tax=Trichodelitschia bisporula TaxID=703511 RepID=A0A6G1HZB4_9PEZI|nr:hypothetical protein EJ06DRAFT_379790 [Trichodelitschia bisporula]